MGKMSIEKYKLKDLFIGGSLTFFMLFSNNTFSKELTHENADRQNIQKQNENLTIANDDPSEGLRIVNVKNREDVLNQEREQEQKDIRIKEIDSSYFAYFYQKYTAYYYKKIEENLDVISGLLDQTYDFSSFLLEGGKVLPPVIIKDNGKIVNISEKVSQETGEQYFIKKKAKIVLVPPTWRDYLYHDFDKPASISALLSPVNEMEKQIIINNREKARKEAKNMAIEIFNESLNRLNSDFKGITRFYFLSEQNMIETPILSQDKVGIKINGKMLSLDQRTFMLSNRGKFKGVKKWNPIFILN